MKVTVSLLLSVFLFAVMPVFSSDHVPRSTSARKASQPPHFVFFGDSLSDTGNFPEPASLNGPKIGNFNFYIPVTNPVPSVLYGVSGIPDADFLRASIGEQGVIQHHERALYSINWPLYLAYSHDHKHGLSTWVHHMQHPKAQVTSMNYAWAGALATTKGNTQCFHDDGEVFPGPCSDVSILTKRQLYMDKTATDPHYDHDHRLAYSDLQIPSLQKQVSLYLDDKRLALANNTVFFVLIGANDIAGYIRSHIILASLLPVSFFRKMADEKMACIAMSVSDSVKRLGKAFGKTGFRYKVYVLTIPHLSDFHSAYSYINIPFFGPRLRRSMDGVVDAYNQHLHESFIHESHVTVMDTGAKIDRLANSPEYRESVDNGTACMSEQSEQYVNPDKVINANCHYDSMGKDRIYFSWNDSHLTTEVNQAVAIYIEKHMG